MKSVSCAKVTATSWKPQRFEGKARPFSRLSLVSGRGRICCCRYLRHCTIKDSRWTATANVFSLAIRLRKPNPCHRDSERIWNTQNSLRSMRSTAARQNIPRSLLRGSSIKRWKNRWRLNGKELKIHNISALIVFHSTLDVRCSMLDVHL